MTKPLDIGTIYTTPDGAGPWVAKEKTKCRLLVGGCDGPMYPPWDGQRRILGRLPPDQLDATEWRDEYRLPKSYDPEKKDLFWKPNMPGWQVADIGWADEPGNERHLEELVQRGTVKNRTPLTPGLVVAFRSWPERDVSGCLDIGTPIVVLDPKDFHTGAVRRLSVGVRGCLSLSTSVFCVLETDDLEVLGRIPLDQLYTATEIPKEPSKTSRGDEPTMTFPKPPLPVGTRFRFRSWPERWGPTSGRQGEEFVVGAREFPDNPFRGKDQVISDIHGNRWSPRHGVLPTDDIEILSTPEPAALASLGKHDSAPPPFTWCGWEISRVPWINGKGHNYQATKGDRVEVWEDPANLLDRIAEAEGITCSAAEIRKHAAETQSWRRTAEKCEKEAATERTAREKAEQDRDKWQTAYEEDIPAAAQRRRDLEQAFRTATEKAEQRARDYDAEAQHERGDRKAVEQAFRAATGHNYEPGRDYQTGWIQAEGGAFQDALGTLQIKARAKHKQKEPPLKPGDRFRFLTFPDWYGYRPTMLDKAFVVGKNNRASYEKEGDTSPDYCWPVEGCTYELLEPVKVQPGDSILSDGSVFRPSKKGNTMKVPFVKPAAFLGKYGALFVLFSALSNPMSLWEGAVNWWTAPTALELGDWTRVHSCDDCRAVSLEPASMCTKCGGETFTERKAQALIEPDRCMDGDLLPQVKGHIFQDGTTTLSPGHWLVPERAVDTRL